MEVAALGREGRVDILRIAGSDPAKSEEGKTGTAWASIQIKQASGYALNVPETVPIACITTSSAPSSTASSSI